MMAEIVLIVIEWFEEKSLRFFRDSCISVMGWHYKAVWHLSTKPFSVDENMVSKFREVLSGWGLTLRELVYHAYLHHLKDAVVW